MIFSAITEAARFNNYPLNRIIPKDTLEYMRMQDEDTKPPSAIDPLGIM